MAAAVAQAAGGPDGSNHPSSSTLPATGTAQGSSYVPVPEAGVRSPRRARARDGGQVALQDRGQPERPVLENAGAVRVQPGRDAPQVLAQRRDRSVEDRRGLAEQRHAVTEAGQVAVDAEQPEQGVPGRPAPGEPGPGEQHPREVECLLLADAEAGQGVARHGPGGGEGRERHRRDDDARTVARPDRHGGQLGMPGHRDPGAPVQADAHRVGPDRQRRARHRSQLRLAERRAGRDDVDAAHEGDRGGTAGAGQVEGEQVGDNARVPGRGVDSDAQPDAQQGIGARRAGPGPAGHELEGKRPGSGQRHPPRVGRRTGPGHAGGGGRAH